MFLSHICSGGFPESGFLLYCVLGERKTALMILERAKEERNTQKAHRKLEIHSVSDGLPRRLEIIKKLRQE